MKWLLKVLFFILLLIPVPILGQDKLTTKMPVSAKDEWWEHVESSPAAFMFYESEGNRWSFRGLINRSKARIDWLEMGCVKKDNGTVKRVSHLSTREVVSLEAGKGWVTDVSVFRNLHKNSCESGGKLSVVKVQFADGGIWQLTLD